MLRQPPPFPESPPSSKGVMYPLVPSRRHPEPLRAFRERCEGSAFSGLDRPADFLRRLRLPYPTARRQLLLRRDRPRHATAHPAALSILKLALTRRRFGRYPTVLNLSSVSH